MLLLYSDLLITNSFLLHTPSSLSYSYQLSWGQRNISLPYILLYQLSSQWSIPIQAYHSAAYISSSYKHYIVFMNVRLKQSIICLIYYYYLRFLPILFNIYNILRRTCILQSKQCITSHQFLIIPVVLRYRGFSQNKKSQLLLSIADQQFTTLEEYLFCLCQSEILQVIKTIKKSKNMRWT